MPCSIFMRHRHRMAATAWQRQHPGQCASGQSGELCARRALLKSRAGLKARGTRRCAVHVCINLQSAVARCVINYSHLVPVKVCACSCESDPTETRTEKSDVGGRWLVSIQTLNSTCSNSIYPNVAPPWPSSLTLPEPILSGLNTVRGSVSFSITIAYG